MQVVLQHGGVKDKSRQTVGSLGCLETVDIVGISIPETNKPVRSENKLFKKHIFVQLAKTNGKTLPRKHYFRLKRYLFGISRNTSCKYCLEVVGRGVTSNCSAATLKSTTANK